MGDLVLDVRDGRLEAPDGVLFADLRWTARDRAVTVLLGPAGTGKSAILRVLAARLDAGWRATGSWRHRGRDLLEQPPSGVVFLPQERGPALAAAGRSRRRWTGVLGSGAPTMLLDEPTRGEAEDSVADLVAALRAQASWGAAVVVTHDLAFAREIADDVTLLCAGEIVAHGPAAAFFESPPNELSRQFLRSGNCSVPPSHPPLPSHFHWVIPGRLAGMGRPGLLGGIEQDLEAIGLAGITHLVTLTEDAQPPARLRPFGLTGRHFPIPDMGVPALGPTASLCGEIERAMKQGAVAVHCHAGLGRTGTILASVLAWLGRSGDDAIGEVRRVARGYIQNRAQADFVRRFSAAVNPAGSDSR